MLNRNKIFSLDGNWFYILDKQDQLNYNEVKRKYLTGETGNVKIPSNWYLTEIGDFFGSVWFIKEFDYEMKKDELSILQFNGVDYFAEVFLNDIYLGKHEGYFQNFFFDISNHIKSEKNVLIVKVTSPREDTDYIWPDRKQLIKGIFNHHDCRPGGWDKNYGQDRNTGGIWNSVLIYSNPSIYFNNLKIFSKIFYQENKALINFELEYYLNSKVNHNINLKGEIKKSEKVIWTNDFQIIRNLNSRISIVAELENPQLWFPYDIGIPELYEFNVYCDNEILLNTHFGIREVELKDNCFYINGKKLFLRGTNLIAEQMLSSLNEDKINFIVTSLKEANINIVRIHAHINRHELYDAFDREGILVWQDFALQWTYDESKEFIANATSQIKDMVKQFHHHPSIVFWCCHNEPGEQIKILDEFLFDAVLREDNSRIVRKASNYEEHCYEGWYWGKKENYVATPMGPLVTEFGAQALPSKDSLLKFIPESIINNPEEQKWNYHNFQYEQTFHIARIDKGNSIDEFIDNSQSYQAELLKKAIHSYRRKKFHGINGIFQFMFIDCWESITWSVIDYFGQKKKGFYALKNSFNPLLLSVNLLQNIYSNLSKRLNLEFWIINDYHKEFSDHFVHFYIDEDEIYVQKIDRIEENSIIHFSFEKLYIRIPEKLSSGFHKLKIELRNQKSELISFDEFQIEYRNI